MQPTPPGRGEFARLLADLQRDTPGLSYQKLADAAGVHRSQVWRWVNAGSAPGYDPVRRLAAWLAGQYPHLADTAARLLPAAGYGDPDEPTLPSVPPVAADQMAGRGATDFARQMYKMAEGIKGEVDAARAAGVPEGRIFTDQHEQALWSGEATVLTPEDQRVLAIAWLRSVRPRPPRSNPGPVELAG